MIFFLSMQEKNNLFLWLIGLFGGNSYLSKILDYPEEEKTFIMLFCFAQ